MRLRLLVSDWVVQPFDLLKTYKVGLLILLNQSLFAYMGMLLRNLHKLRLRIDHRVVGCVLADVRGVRSALCQLLALGPCNRLE